FTDLASDCQQSPSPLTGEGWGGGGAEHGPKWTPPTLALPRKGGGNSEWSVPSSDGAQSSRGLFDLGEAAHVGAQHLGNDHRAVRLLVVLEHGDERASDREAGAVERVHEARVLAALRLVAGIHAPRLEVAAHRARRNLAVSVLARQPHLDVVRLLRG